MQAPTQSSSVARIFASSAQISPSSPIGQDPSSSPSTPAAILPAAGRKPSFPEDVSLLSERAGLAHDAGNLLHALGLYCDLLQMPGVLRPEHKHYATELRQIFERSSAMLLRLLKSFAPRQAAQPEAPAPLPTPALPATEARPAAAQACINPAQVLHGQFSLLQRLTAPWAIVSVATQDPLPSLEFSAEILERITVNLVLNAAEALRNAREGRPSPSSGWAVSEGLADSSFQPDPEEVSADPEDEKPGRIRVSLRMAAERLRLSVEDNGPGLPPAIAASFFQPTPLPPGSSRGLGHRIVHELVEATGGQLSVRVRPGAGTTVYVDWPVQLATVSGAESATLRLVSPQNASGDPPARRERSRTNHGGPNAC